MATNRKHKKTVYECVGENPHSIAGSNADTYGAFFYFVLTTCNYGLPCPPHVNNRVITCVVCTK